MPSLDATKSLLLSKTSLSNLKTNSAVVASLLKTPPTNYGTLYTGLMLAQGISAELFGPDRNTHIWTFIVGLWSFSIQLETLTRFLDLEDYI